MREKEKSKRGAMAFGRSVINKGPEMHSDPVIDLTTGAGTTHTPALWPSPKGVALQTISLKFWTEV